MDKYQMLTEYSRPEIIVLALAVEDVLKMEAGFHPNGRMWMNRYWFSVEYLYKYYPALLQKIYRTEKEELKPWLHRIQDARNYMLNVRGISQHSM
jgi:hypothetical protein